MYNLVSQWTKSQAESHNAQTFLCERIFPDYAECEPFITFTVLDSNTLQPAILQRTESQAEDIIQRQPLRSPIPKHYGTITSTRSC